MQLSPTVSFSLRSVGGMFPKGPVTRCNFSCNLQRNPTLKRCIN